MIFSTTPYFCSFFKYFKLKLLGNFKCKPFFSLECLIFSLSSNKVDCKFQVFLPDSFRVQLCCVTSNGDRNQFD